MQRVVLGQAQEANGASARLHVLSPIVTGFAVPVIAIAVINPSILQHGQQVALVLLGPLFVVTCGLFLYAVFAQKTLAAVVIDAGQAQATLIETTLLARSTETIPFAALADIRVRQGYDDDGYPHRFAELVWRNGETLRLPEGSDEGALAAAQTMIRQARTI